MAKDSKKINILLISRDFPPRIGGVATYNRNLLNVFKNKKNIFFNVLTFQPKQNFQKQIPYLTKEKNAKIIRLSWPKIIGDPSGIDSSNVVEKYCKAFFYGSQLMIKGFFYLVKHRKEIDVIYGTGGELVLLVIYILKIFRKPTICHFHHKFRFSSRIFLLRYLAYHLCHSCNYLFANSLDCKKDLLKLGLSEDKIVLIHHWADFNLFKPINKDICIKSLNLPNDKFIFLSVARLSEDKQIDLLLQAIKHINQEINNFLFLFIGDGEKRDKVIKWTNKYKNIIYLGERNINDLPKFINAADLTWGICDVSYIAMNAVESLACGVPVIAPSKVYPASGEVNKLKVKDSTLPKKIGFLVNPNPQSIAKKLLWINKNREILNSMKKDCRNFAARKYGYKNVEKIYNLILELT